MASSDRDQSSPVGQDGGPTGPEGAPAAGGQVNETLRRARELGFFRFVAMAERLTSEAVRIGGDGPINAEAIRFRHDPSMAFNASDITSARAIVDDGLRFEVTTSFLGLFGSVTPLPLYVAEELVDEEGGEAQRAFLDLFHHRLLSLLYRGLMKYQVAAEATQKGGDAWYYRLLALVGIDARTQEMVLSPSTLLGLLPALVATRRSPAALENALAHRLAAEVPRGAVHVEPLIGEWVQLDERDLCRLGVANHRLGGGMILGTRMFDRSGRFRIEIGPVSFNAFERLRPGGPLRATVDAAVALFVHDWLSYEVSVTIDETRARLRLSSARDGSRLGIDSWLGEYVKETASVRMGDGQRIHNSTRKGSSRT
jgi:type VI secretion system protein ImpH